MLKTIHWGIIGCGDVTELKSGPAFGKVNGSRLVAVMRRDKDKARDYAQRHNVPKWYGNAVDLINDSEINAIYVATPPLFHADYAIKAMKAGKPVYVEKPMAVNYSNCNQMVKVSAETGIPLFVAYYRRSLPYFLKVRELLTKGIIGNIHSVSIQLISSPRQNDYNNNDLPWRVNRDIAGGGYFYDMACHQLDLLDFFIGPVSEVYGTFSNRKGLYTAEDNVTASFRFENGVTGTGFWNFVADDSSRSDIMLIVGELGTISFSAFEFTPIQVTTSREFSEFKPENPENIQFHLIKDVVEELQGIGKSPSDGNSAARTNKVMDIILRKI